MRSFVFGFLIIGFLAPIAGGADPQDQLFKNWEKTQRDIKSLVVEFTLERKNLLFDVRQKFEGKFRLIRTGHGKILASYEHNEKKPKDRKPTRWSGLLNNGVVYFLDHDKHMALRFEPEGGDLWGFLETYFNPFVPLLDRKRAEAKYRLKVVKRDEWYTYLSVKPREAQRSGGWHTDNFRAGQAVFMNKASESVPKYMPRQLWYTDATQESTFVIKTWRLNAAEATKPEDFARPEDRPGWQVSEWPFKAQQK